MLKDFNKINKELERLEKKREEAIQNSRKIIKISKQIIYSVHRDNFKKASEQLKEINKKIKKLEKETYETSIVNTAFQEYVEAVCYYEFVKNNKVPSFKELNVDVVNYLMGLCDLSGELVRKAVRDIIKKKYDEVIKIRDFIEDLHGEFLKFDLRNGDLRKKSDSIKWNLKKVEDLALSVEKK